MNIQDTFLFQQILCARVAVVLSYALVSLTFQSVWDRFYLHKEIGRNKPQDTCPCRINCLVLLISKDFAAAFILLRTLHLLLLPDRENDSP